MIVKHKNLKESFQLLLSLGDGYDGENFTIAFTSGKLQNKTYVCKYDGSEYTNCSMADSTHVLCVLDDTGLPCGLLSASITVEFPDTRLADGTYTVGDTRLVEALDENSSPFHIELTQGHSDYIPLSEMTWDLLGNVMKGDKGDRGADSVYVGEGDMPDDCNFQVDPSATPIPGDFSFIHITETEDAVNINANAKVTGTLHAVGNFSTDGTAKVKGEMTAQDNINAEKDIIVTAFDNIHTDALKLGEELERIDLTSLINKADAAAKISTLSFYDITLATLYAAIACNNSIFKFTAEQEMSIVAKNGFTVTYGSASGPYFSLNGDGASIYHTNAAFNCTTKGAQFLSVDNPFKFGFSLSSPNYVYELGSTYMNYDFSDNMKMSLDSASERAKITSPEILWTKKTAAKGELNKTVTYETSKTASVVENQVYYLTESFSIKQGETIDVDTDGHKVILIENGKIIASDDAEIIYQAVKDITLTIGTEEAEIYAQTKFYDAGVYHDESVSFAEMVDNIKTLKSKVESLEEENAALALRVTALENPTT